MDAGKSFSQVSVNGRQGELARPHRSTGDGAGGGVALLDVDAGDVSASPAGSSVHELAFWALPRKERWHSRARPTEVARCQPTRFPLLAEHKLAEKGPTNKINYSWTNHRMKRH